MKPNAVFAAIVLTACAAAVLPLHAADPVVASVVSAQRAGTKLVDITFDVSDADSDQLDISVQISDDSGTTFLVPVTALSGDTSVTATPTAAAKALVWDASVDFNQQFNSTMVVRVIADDGSAPGPPPAGMVLIPAGPFEMGFGTFAPEGPVHTVTVSAFYLDQFEVTKALWDDVQDYANANGYSASNGGFGQSAFHPVHTVGWYECVIWCNARSEKEGLTPVYYMDAGLTIVWRGQTGLPQVGPFPNWQANGFRLPTEAEWEKAARGTLVGNTYPWGNSITGADANYASSGDPFESGSASEPDTTPVGYYDGDQVPVGVNRANGYGLYDMAGNVSEWCWDLFDPSYYASSPANDPRGPDPASGFFNHVMRGGSWPYNADAMRCAVRAVYYTERNDIGFRTARGL